MAHYDQVNTVVLATNLKLIYTKVWCTGHLYCYVNINLHSAKELAKLQKAIKKYA